MKKKEDLSRKVLKELAYLIAFVIIVLLLGGDNKFAEIFSQKYEEYSETLTTQEPQYTELYDVKRVVDGDTIVIDINGVDTTVRFIGIDTPESVNPDESKNTEEGKIASNFTKELLTNKKVYLEYDVQINDKYGRTLAYVYMEDGTMVNEYVIAEGYAYILTITPNVKYSDRFVKAFEEAQANNKGLWNKE